MEPVRTHTYDEAATALIEEHVRRLMTTMGLSHAKIYCSTEDKGAALHIDVDAGNDSRILIGAQGRHLNALQHIIRCLIRRQIKQPTRIMVDVNGYRARREQSLFNLAEETAKKAHRTGRTVILEPMTAADRRAVHTALAQHKNIQTESLGDEPNRRVIIRPIFL